MVNILVALNVWEVHWTKCQVKMYIDNRCVADICNSGYTRDVHLTAIARNIWLITSFLILTSELFISLDITILLLIFHQDGLVPIIKKKREKIWFQLVPGKKSLMNIFISTMTYKDWNKKLFSVFTEGNNIVKAIASSVNQRIKQAYTRKTWQSYTRMFWGFLIFCMYIQIDIKNLHVHGVFVTKWHIA